MSSSLTSASLREPWRHTSKQKQHDVESHHDEASNASKALSPGCSILSTEPIPQVGRTGRLTAKIMEEDDPFSQKPLRSPWCLPAVPFTEPGGPSLPCGTAPARGQPSQAEVVLWA